MTDALATAKARVRDVFECVVCEKTITSERYHIQRRPICQRCTEESTTMNNWNGSSRSYGGWNIGGTTRGDKVTLRRLAALTNELQWSAVRANQG